MILKSSLVLHLEEVMMSRSRMLIPQHLMGSLNWPSCFKWCKSLKIELIIRFKISSVTLVFVCKNSQINRWALDSPQIIKPLPKSLDSRVSKLTWMTLKQMLRSLKRAWNVNLESWKGTLGTSLITYARRKLRVSSKSISLRLNKTRLHIINLIMSCRR